MKNADVKSALQKKSPGQRPGHSSLKRKSTRPIILLSRGRSVRTRACHGPRLTKSPVSFATEALYRIPFMPVLVIYIIVIKFLLAFLLT